MGDEGVPLEQIEDTVTIDAPPGEVYAYLSTVERLAVTDAVTTDWRGGRAILAIAPQGANGSILTMMVDAPAGAEAGVEMRVRMRQELARVAAAVEERAGSIAGVAGADDVSRVETGLTAIEDDQAEGEREAPFADDPSHRP